MPKETSVTFKKPEIIPTSPSDSVIDFHAPEFNRPDALNDLTGNYRSFQPLGDIITTDMRHQMERQHSRSETIPFEGQTKASGDKTPEDGDSPIESPEPLTVISEGRLLLVDSDIERALGLARELNGHGLTCTLVNTHQSTAKPSLSERGNTNIYKADRVTIAGAFGRFLPTLTVAGQQTPLAIGFAEKSAFFDLVLDLQLPHSYFGMYLPLGYYAIGSDGTKLAQAMAELPEMRGRFLRPQFTSFLKERCFHGRSRKSDCRRCLGVCPFGAIESIERRISIDPFLCQGCGACALICPSDAIILNEPSRDESIRNLMSLVKNGLSPHSPPVTLVLRDSCLGKKFGHPPPQPASTHGQVYLEFETDPLKGLDMLLAALAFGAREILIPWGPLGSPHIRQVLEFQIEMARAVLNGLGWDMERIRLIDLPSDDNLPREIFPKGDRPAAPWANPLTLISPPFHPTPNADKRSLVRQSAQYLFDSSPAQDPILPLPDGSPFGTVVLDKEACTLCLACASACPSGGLSAGGSTPRLLLQESRCHQCGLCQAACPERALHLIPRLLCDPIQVQSHIVLQEAEPFFCIECGRPFAPPAMIHHIQDKLQGHWMYTETRQMRRLQMCRTCRARDALTSSDWKIWNQS